MLHHRLLAYSSRLFSVFLTLWIYVISPLLTINVIGGYNVLAGSEKIKACHVNNNTASYKEIESNSWNSHEEHGDFLYEGPLDATIEAKDTWCFARFQLQPTPTITNTPTASPEIKPTQEPTIPPEPTILNTPVLTPTGVVTPTPSETPIPTDTQIPTTTSPIPTSTPIIQQIAITPNDSGFMASMYSVREDNYGSDVAAQVYVPANASNVRFRIVNVKTSFDQSIYDTDTTNNSYDSDTYKVSGATVGQQWWRLQEGLSGGSYIITGEFQVSTLWHPITGSTTLHVIDTPWYTYIIPSSDNQYFRPTDNFARIKIDDEFTQTNSVVFRIFNATTNAQMGPDYSLNRSLCDLRNEGSSIECDLMRDFTGIKPALIDGIYYIRTQSYGSAGSGIRFTNTKSNTFIIDGTRPELSDFRIENAMSVFTKTVEVSTVATDNYGVANVEFYITRPRSSDNQCDGNGTKLDTKTIASVDLDGRYHATFDTSAYNEKLCVNAIAEDLANSHSNPILKTAILVDNEAPAVPTGLRFLNPALSCGAYTTTGSTTVDWNDVAEANTYEYMIDYPYANGTGRGVWTTTLKSSQYSGALNQGVHHIKVRAIDTVGNKSVWSTICDITYDSIAPDVQLTSPMETVLSGTVPIRGSVQDQNPHHYWLVIQKVGGSNVAGPGTIINTAAFTDKLFFNWNTGLVTDGQYIIKLEARDAAGNKDTGSVVWRYVTVDNYGPVITVPEDITVTAPNDLGVPVAFSVSALDTLDGSIAVNCNKQTGDTFLLGQTLVTCTAADSHGNLSSKAFMVTVTDTVKPQADLQFPGIGPDVNGFSFVFTENVREDEAENPANYFLQNWPTAGGSGDLSGDAQVTYDHTTYTATITFLSQDWYISPEQQWGVQNIHDITGNILSVNPATEYSTAMRAPTTTDTIDGLWHNSDVTIMLNCDDGLSSTGSGCYKTFYRINGGESHEGNSITFTQDGVYTLSYYSQDRAGNYETEKTASLTINIDKTGPFLIIPANQTFDEDASGSYHYSFKPVATEAEFTATTADTTSLEVTCTHNPEGFNYATGVTTVECSASDRAGNSTLKNFSVTVNNVVPTVSINASTLDSGAIRYTAIPNGGNKPFTYQWHGSCTGSGVTTTTGTTPATYTCSVTVTDADGDSAISASLARTIVEVEQEQRNPAVLGEQTNTPSNQGTGENLKEVVPEVLGERTCLTQVAYTAYIFIDSKSNGYYNDDETKVPKVSGQIVYINEGKEYTAATFKTDDSGKFSTNLCPGDYNIVLGVDTLPQNVTAKDKYPFTIPAGQENLIGYIALLPIITKKASNSKWLIIPLAILFILGYYLFRRRETAVSTSK